MVNPVYHLRRIREDISLMFKALRERQAYDSTHNHETLAKLFRGKLLSSFFITGPSAFVSMGLAYWAQRIFKSPWVGAVATVVFATIITTLAYQVFWWFDNRRLYQRQGHNVFEGLLEMQRDLWPVHLYGIRIGLTFLLVVAPINGIIIRAIELASPQFAEVFPVPIIMAVVDAVAVQGTFARIMGDYFDRHSQRLATKYYSVLAASA